ncbi:MAG: ATP-binding cassette domain-containing protein [Bacteroidales bacterium]|nr:ATP-binding cassette domain-containing protein [Bacteroidales bacterium]
MKRNIFQKQDDSEIDETTENNVVSEKNVDSEAENTTKSTPSGLTDIINLVNINQVYAEHNPPNIVFKDFNFDIKDIKERGQFITIMGKSGCGKSTLLRYISGLQVPTSGEVYIYGKKRTEKDRIPMVFQQYTSFEWKTVLQNVALPLILKGIDKAEANHKAMEMIKIVGLAGHENKWAKYPILSGGQLQRVAIARNLVVNPQILLMDEPFGALDTVTRKQIQVFLRSIFENAKIDPTIVFVTHSESEAVFLSTDIIILDSGPASIRHHLKIELPEQRNDSVRYSTEFTDYVNKLGALMEDLKNERK